LFSINSNDKVARLNAVQKISKSVLASALISVNVRLKEAEMIECFVNRQSMNLATAGAKYARQITQVRPSPGDDIACPQLIITTPLPLTGRHLPNWHRFNSSRKGKLGEVTGRDLAVTLLQMFHKPASGVLQQAEREILQVAHAIAL
jgi:hypothetical protein